MKKVMVMLGAVALAACTQAASFNWATGSSCYGITTAQLDSLSNGTVYDAATSGTANRMSKQSTIAWTYALVFTDAADSTKVDTLTGTPKFNSTSKISDTLSSDLVVAGKDLNYSVVFTGTYTDANDVEWTLTSNEIAGSWHVNDQGDLSFSMATPTSWTATSAAVPEPTSGLLMLVGLAGLALRRRRA